MTLGKTDNQNPSAKTLTIGGSRCVAIPRGLRAAVPASPASRGPQGRAGHPRLRFIAKDATPIENKPISCDLPSTTPIAGGPEIRHTPTPLSLP